MLSRRVLNDESELGKVINAVFDRADKVKWAIDLADGPAALMITLLLERGQRLVFLPGIAVNRVSGAYRGEGKTDAKDAARLCCVGQTEQCSTADGWRGAFRGSPRAARTRRGHDRGVAGQPLARSGRGAGSARKRDRSRQPAAT